jgi:hypothetical protein
MVEFSFAEIALFIWAAIATGYALKYKYEAHVTEVVLRKVIEDKKVRDELVGQWEKFNSHVG